MRYRILLPEVFKAKRCVICHAPDTSADPTIGSILYETPTFLQKYLAVASDFPT